ncbi:hypothetical protein [Streptomyces sp. NPDC060184]|uniref:hypothetical protein n=1 Tax=Streptomyces sp. NPDC060184 TaxID=3347064 RepID=UPI00365E1722
MSMIKVPLEFRCSAVESAVENQHHRSSQAVSSISAVETGYPAPCARKKHNAEKPALTALMELPPKVTCGNGSSINGTATELPHGGAR